MSFGWSPGAAPGDRGSVGAATFILLIGKENHVDTAGAPRLPDFFSLGERLRAYVLGGVADHDSDRAMEATRRVDEMEWILVRCRSLEAVAVALEESRDEFSLTGHQERTAVLELRILVEAFYHSAWRLITLLDHKDQPVLGITKLKEKCPGIQEVRNQLLAHPEGKHSRVFMQSFSYGGESGPKLKNVREDLELADHTRHAWVDRGLYANAAELADALGSMLPEPRGTLVYSPPRLRA